MTSVDPGLSEFFKQQGRYPIRCGVRLVLEELDPERAALLRKALETPKLQHAAISRTVKNWGIALLADSVRRHRQGACHCGR